MKPPKFKTKTFPVPSDDLDRPLRSVDIMINFDYFDPERGATTPTNRGFNVLPWRGDLKYYSAVRDDGTTPLLKSTNFDEIWTHVNS